VSSQWSGIFDNVGSNIKSQDSACIDQSDDQNKARGVSALPLIVVQCNAIISLVDKTYYKRAWCAVEVLMMQTMASYKQHRCFEHRLYSNSADLVSGYLQQRVQNFEVDEIAKLEVTLESDRPTIAFLVRQSKLLGRSDS
jgi:hypothetical protein